LWVEIIVPFQCDIIKLIKESEEKNVGDSPSVVISLLALFISATTLWFTLLRQGKLVMTKPTVIFFGHDTVLSNLRKPKIFLRTLLYSTAAQGKVIEGMYIKLIHGKNEQAFSFWAYGEREKLVPGSGLYIGQTGVAANHHFVLAMNNLSCDFVEGNYTIQVFARVVGKTTPIMLSQIPISLTQEHVLALSDKCGLFGVFFEVGPDDHGYISHIDKRPL
jgi:hypothetical protein